jgi:tetratricopeptide (TPR) repeat protein
MNNDTSRVDITGGRVQGLIVGEVQNLTQNFEGQKRPVRAFNPPSQPFYRLFGRENLLQNLKKRLCNGVSLALKGLPGVGKTALVLELAYDPDVHQYFNGGVLWAKLGQNSDVMAVLLEWSTALGISQSVRSELTSVTNREETIEILRQRIQERINDGDKKILVVIDDAWQTETVSVLKIGTPNCVYIATTRFSSVALDFVGKEGLQYVDELSESSSFELLEQVAGDVIQTHDNKVKKLAKAVGYLPLALILIARHLQKLADSGFQDYIEKALEDLKRVEARLRLEQSQISPGSSPSLPKDAPLSLIAVIAVSDEALDKETKLVLRALSVFPPKPNTFSQNAALLVSSNPDTTSLYKLYDSGLLEKDRSGRYTLHQTISDYGREKLTEKTAYIRLATLFTDYVRNNAINYSLLDQEYINIIAALEIAITMQIYPIAIQGVNAFYPFLEAKGLYERAGSFLKKIQELFNSPSDSHDLAETFLNLGRVNQRLGEYTHSKNNLQRAIHLAEKFNHTEIIIYSKLNLGILEEIQGDDKRAERFYQEALHLADLTGNHKAFSILCRAIGALLIDSQAYWQAKKYFERGLDAARRIRDEQVICGLLINFGWTAIILDSLEEAEKIYKESLNIVSKLKHYEYAVYIRQGMGEIAKKRRDYKQAKYHYERGLALARRTRFKEREVVLLQSLGAMLTEQGDYKQANDNFLKAFSLASEIRNYQLVDHLLKDLGRVANIQCHYQQVED